MITDQQPPEIFARNRRLALRERAGRRAGDAFLWKYISQDLAERLALVSREFDDVLILGPMTAYADVISAARSRRLTLAGLSTSEAVAGGAVVEEDRLPFDPAAFDLVICAGTLDSVNDLPGALVQIRRCLRPDGLFLGHMFGAGTLATLKAVMMAAEGGAISPHIHPQIGLRAAADLLTRAGFALPVADQDIMPVGYRDWRRLVADLRDMGLGNALAGQRRYLGRKTFSTLDTEWLNRSVDGAPVQEQFVHLNLSGWAPSPDQPKPAKRGSGSVSLASVLSERKALPDENG